MAHYYLPSGRCVHKRRDAEGKIIDPDWGVTPDKQLELREALVKDRWKESVVFDTKLERYGSVFMDVVRPR